MTEINMQKLHFVGKGFAEMPQNGRRYRFEIARYRHDDGSEFGEVLSMTEVPDVGLYSWIPSWATRSEDEAEYLHQEQEYEKEHPHPEDVERMGEHRATQKKRMDAYNEMRDKRADLIKKNHRTLRGGTPHGD